MRGVRYRHLGDRGEVERLAVKSGLQVWETFHADGHKENLSLFVALDKQNEAH